METKLKATGGGAGALHLGHEGSEAVAIWNLSVLIKPDDQFWFAQGLEINYGAQGDTPEEAKENFQLGLLATIDLHLRVYGDIERLLKFAPRRVLQEAAKHKYAIKQFMQVSFHDIARDEVQKAIPFTGIEYRVMRQAA
jgi:hypothetical protein